MKSPTELKEMDDDQLFQYFCEHAGYYELNPPKSQYSIRIGSKSVFSHDTDDLKKKFFKAVRNGQ